MPTDVAREAEDELRWRPLYRAGAASALAILAFMVFQVVVFLTWPPPTTVPELFALFESHPLLGLLDMDLLLIVDYVLTSVVVLAIVVAGRGHRPAWLGLALLFELLSVAIYVPSNTAFSMWLLSGQHAAATSEAERASCLAAGRAMMALYQGTAFDVSYVLGGLSFLALGIAFRGRVGAPRGMAPLTLFIGATMLLPPTAGAIALVLSLLSLLPLAVWLPVTARWLLGSAARRAPGAS
ncbi:MAG: hypothetical protein U0234_25050 [Sandaracinus sp.]